MPNLLQGLNLNDPNVRNSLPEWIRRQIVPVSQDENGPQFGFNGLYDEDGNQVFQVDENHSPTDSSTGDLSLHDPSAFRQHSQLGNITDIRNVRNVQSASFRNGLLATQLAIAAMTGYGAYSAMGAGAAGAEGAGGLLGAGEGLGAGAAGDAFAGATATGEVSGGLLGAAGEGAAGTGLLSGGNPAFTEQMVINGSRIPAGLGAGEATLLGGAGIAGAGAIANGGNNPFDGSQAEGDVTSERPWYETLTNNPLQTLGRGLSLYNLGRGLLSDNENDNDNDNNGDGDKGGNGTAVNTTLQRQPWTPNPITAAQIQNFQYARPRGM